MSDTAKHVSARMALLSKLQMLAVNREVDYNDKVDELCKHLACDNERLDRFLAQLQKDGHLVVVSTSEVTTIVLDSGVT